MSMLTVQLTLSCKAHTDPVFHIRKVSKPFQPKAGLPQLKQQVGFKPGMPTPTVNTEIY